MPLRVDPATAAQDWASGLAGATEKIRRGVQRVNVSPGQAAAAKADLWVQNTAAARQKFANNVGRVSLAQWQQDTIAAVGRVAEGAQRKQNKFATAIAPVFAHMANVLSTVDNMPSGTFEQNVNRMNAFVRGMHQYNPPAGGGVG